MTVDLPSVQHLLAGSTEALLAPFEELTVENEPEIVTELRHLALESTVALRYAAQALADERRLHPGPYASGKRTFTRGTRIYDLIEERGGLLKKHELPRNLDPNAVDDLADAVEDAYRRSSAHDDR